MFRLLAGGPHSHRESGFQARVAAHGQAAGLENLRDAAIELKSKKTSGEASDPFLRRATPRGVAFVRLGLLAACCRCGRHIRNSARCYFGVSASEPAGKPTCQPHPLAVISELPIKRLTRFTPFGQSKLVAEQANFAGKSTPFQTAR